jgi:predicted dehydrogenase
MLKGVAAGAGYFSQYHFEAWRRIPGVEITALCGLDAAQARAMAAAHGIARVYADVEAMLDTEKPDFIDIITPPASHAAIAQAAGRRGVHILCQKALAPTVAEAAAIVAAAKASGVRLMVHDNFRFQPWHREMRRLLDDGAIGTLQAIACRTRLGDGWGPDAYLARQPYFRTMKQLLVFETGVHFIDVFR